VGVDLDFPLVLQGIAPLGRSILAAGRCYCKGKLGEKGRVIVFTPEAIPTVSAVLGDGTILETVVYPEAKRTSFVLAKDGELCWVDSVPTDSSARLVPYSPRNNLFAHEVVLLPSGPEEYGSEDALLPEVESFIHRYVDVSPLFEKIACYHVS